jgi:hypothetical protein
LFLIHLRDFEINGYLKIRKFMRGREEIGFGGGGVVGGKVIKEEEVGLVG